MRIDDRKAMAELTPIFDRRTVEAAFRGFHELPPMITVSFGATPKVEASARRMRVLVADDDPITAKRIAELPEIDVIEVTDGWSAVERLKDGDVDLALCALKIGELSGAKIHKLVATANPKMARRIVYLASEAAVSQAPPSSASGRVLARPISPDAVRSMLDTLGTGDVMDLGEASRRALHRLTLFADTIPADAVVALAAIERSKLAGMIRAGTLVAHGSAFRIAPEARALAAALPPSAAEAKGDIVRHGEWLLRAMTSMEVAQDTRVTFDLLEPLLPDVRLAIARLGEHAEEEAKLAELAARLWCAIADVLFYRRALPFDAPEYAHAVRWADAGAAPAVRVATRIYAGRAAMEVTPATAKRWFDDARTLARAAALRDLGADATRGLGWYVLANGDIEEARTLFDEARAVHEELANMRGIADACMAQAVASALSGDLDATSRLLFRAEAILRARRDSVRLEKLGNLRAMFGGGGQPWSDVTVDDWLSRGQYWRAALALAHREENHARDRARILAELAGVAWEKLLATKSEDAPPSEEQPRWILRMKGARRILFTPDGRELDITRRGPLVKMIEALGRAKGPVGPIELFEAAWPGESVRHESALYRVYTTVRRLRALGLPIATTADGYWCEPLRTDA